MLEPLSLENFDPVYAREPYLTTPRSLEACRHHGVHPEELVEVPFREFQRAYPDDPEIALRRFERVDTARKILLESVYHKWQEVCWEQEHRPKGGKKKKAGREAVIELEDGKRLTVLEMQAERFRKVEKQQWKGLRNKLFMEMKKAVHDQKAKTIIEKQDNIGDTAIRRRRELEQERERKMKADLAEASEKEKDQAREVRVEQRAALVEAKAKTARDKQNVRKAKKAQLNREQERLAREDYRNLQKSENYHRLRSEAIERNRQLVNQEKELEQRMNKERKKKEGQDQLKKTRTMNRLLGAKEELARQAQLKMVKVSKSIEDFDSKVEKLKEDKQTKWKSDMAKNSGRSEEHLDKVRTSNKEKTDEKINATLGELERRDELARQVFEENEEQRHRRQAIKDVRQQSFELAAIRRKKAMDFRKEQLEDSIRAKDERYKAIKDGEKALKRMTESITEVISKTKMELTCQMNRLNSKDMLTADNVMTKVHEHNDTVLFPRLRNRFAQMPLEDDEGPSPSSSVDLNKPRGDEQKEEEEQEEGQEEQEEEEQEEEKQEQAPTGNGLASTLPPPSSTLPASSKPQSSSSSRPHTTGTGKGGGGLSKTTPLRPKPPTAAMGIKILSKSKINETLDIMRMTLEESVAAKEAGSTSTPKKKTGGRKVAKKDNDPLNLSGKQKPWLNGDDDSRELEVGEEEDFLLDSREGASAASSLEENQHQHQFAEGSRSKSNTQLMRKNTPFPGDLKPKSKLDKKSAPHNSSMDEGLFDELEEVEDEGVDDDDIVARIEGTPKAQQQQKPQQQRAQTISARPLTPEGKFRAEYSKDHPFAGGKGQYSRESAAGKQRLVPGKRRQPPAPERLAEVMSKQEQKKYDLQRQLEELRKHQNEALLEVLEDERGAEEQRTGLGRGVSDTKERNRLELVFAEERKRASERIIAMTKDHEQKMKQVILAMDLGS